VRTQLWPFSNHSRVDARNQKTSAGEKRSQPSQQLEPANPGEFGIVIRKVAADIAETGCSKQRITDA
jgi:hypothetical protein